MMQDVPANKMDRSTLSIPCCSHYRSTLVYVASVAKKCNFLGQECTDCGEVRLTDGCHIDLNGRTMSLPPYNECQASDNLDFYVSAPSNNYPYCPENPV